MLPQTDGGWRIFSAEQVNKRLDPYVSPLTGIIAGLTDASPKEGLPVFQATQTNPVPTGPRANRLIGRPSGAAGKGMGRRVEHAAEPSEPVSAANRTVIFGFGRVGRMVADMLREHDRPYLAVDSDVDTVRVAHEEGYNILFGDVSRPELSDRLQLGHAAALVLTMDDPVQVARITRRVRGWVPQLPIIARARDTRHAAQLYKAGVTDAVPETLEASLQLAEAVLVDVGAPMGPVIASIHEKRSQLRARIMSEAEMEAEPRLGRRSLRDSAQSSKADSKRSTPAV